MAHRNKQNYALTYLFILAFGSTILYFFSLMHEVTGFAAASDTPSQCQSFASENDAYCDDDKEVCADKYVEGTSLAACHECTTGAWKQLKWCKGTAQPTPEVPAECQGYASADDPYCDELQENCADKYVEGTSVPACRECTTGQWKQSKWCKGAAANAWPDTGPDSALCKEFFDDVTCDDSPKDCGNDYKSGNSIDHCNECQTGALKCSIVKESKPNLYIASFSGLQPKTETGLYGYNHDLPGIFRPLRLYEVNSDNSIVKDSNGKKKSISEITFSFIISNNGNPTYEQFSIALQRLKKDSSGWETLALGVKNLVLLESSATVEWKPLNENIAYYNPKLRLVVDSGNKIDESNENDNQYLFDIPMSKIK